MHDTSIIEIDLTAVAHNMSVLRRIVGPECAICPIVKADAYGLGVVRIAKCLFQQHAGGGADMIAVYTARQAAELFNAAVMGPVLVLMPVREIGRADELYRALICGRLHLSAHDAIHLDDLIRLSDRYAVTIPLHLEIDTGMSRGGCNLADAPAALRRIHSSPRLRLAGIYTHFASAEADEELTDRQDRLFTELLTEQADFIPADCLIHAANTFATIRDRKYHKSMVRIGQAWAGYGPEGLQGGRVIAEAQDLQPAVTWASELVHIKKIPKSTPVGYGSVWTAPRDSVVGLIPLGYADGYPLSLSGRDGESVGGQVAVLQEHPTGTVRRYAPVIGAVNMDQITIDLTDIESGALSGGAPGGLRVGTPVELITPDRGSPNHLPKLAQTARTSPYEILCRLNPRIRRVYHRAAASVEILAASPSAAARPAVAAG